MNVSRSCWEKEGIFFSRNYVKGTKSKGSLKMILFMYRLALKLKL